MIMLDLFVKKEEEENNSAGAKIEKEEDMSVGSHFLSPLLVHYEEDNDESRIGSLVKTEKAGVGLRNNMAI